MRLDNVIIVHNTEHLEAAFAVAEELAIPVSLQTPAAAIGYMGAPFIKEMLDQALLNHPQAKYTFICDAGDDPAHVQEAFDVGLRTVRFTGSPLVREKLDSIAEYYQGTLCFTEDDVLEVLDLCFVENPKEACKRWYLAMDLVAA